jgi:hypothetical protein
MIIAAPFFNTSPIGLFHYHSYKNVIHFTTASANDLRTNAACFSVIAPSDVIYSIHTHGMAWTCNTVSVSHFLLLALSDLINHPYSHEPIAIPVSTRKLSALHMPT